MRSVNRVEDKKNKFWVVHNIPSPYRLHLFSALWEECMRRELDFHVHFMSDMSHGYEERPVSWRNPDIAFPHTFWRDYGIGQRHVNPFLLWHLWRNHPEYLLSGSPFDTLAGMLAGRVVSGVKCTWCEGNTKTPGQMNGLKGFIKRFALSGYNLVAVPGSDAAKYIDLHRELALHKMPSPVLLPNLIDESRFRAGSLRDKHSDYRQAIIPARLKPVKGLLEFIDLLNPDLLRGWKILIVGDGELKVEIENRIRIRGVTEKVSIEPFVAYSEMPKYYAESDLLILPSLYDPNPLAVVEALHCGLPLALSSEAGNVEEAVTEGKNGWVLPVRDKCKFANVLEEVFSTSRKRLAEMGAWSKCHNSKFWDTRKAVKKFVDRIVHQDKGMVKQIVGQP